MNKPNLKQKELFSNYPDVLNVRQLREALGIGRKAVYNSLTDEQAEKFAGMFENPEMFLVGEEGIIVLPVM